MPASCSPEKKNEEIAPVQQVNYSCLYKGVNCFSIVN